MQKYFLVLFFLHPSLTSISQEAVRKYVQENAFPLKTVDPDSTNYADLQKIGNAIGDAKIVMLGEQDHGDATAFLAKTRLIKYLHENKGFNVLAFESDFFGLNYGWDLVKKGELTADRFIKMNISPLWTNCYACNPLFNNYIPSAAKSNMPLILSGFDNNMNTKVLFPILDSVLKALQLPFIRLPDYRSNIWPLIQTWYKYTNESIENRNIAGYLREIKEQMLQKLSENDFWIITVDNLIQELEAFKDRKKDYWKDMNTRDMQMALNLQWLNKIKYPREKIIVWAHNYHVSKYAGNYPDDFLNKAKTMGTLFTSDSTNMSQTYIVGFTSSTGKAGRVFEKQYNIEKPRINSLENWINEDYSFAFLDFKKYNQVNTKQGETFYMAGATKGNRYHSSQLAEWNRIFDGIFYIRNMQPCAP